MSPVRIAYATWLGNRRYYVIFTDTTDGEADIPEEYGDQDFSEVFVGKTKMVWKGSEIPTEMLYALVHKKPIPTTFDEHMSNVRAVKETL